jgi:hypothetical protein
MIMAAVDRIEQGEDFASRIHQEELSHAKSTRSTMYSSIHFCKNSVFPIPHDVSSPRYPF